MPSLEKCSSLLRLELLDLVKYGGNLKIIELTELVDSFEINSSHLFFASPYKQAGCNKELSSKITSDIELSP